MTPKERGEARSLAGHAKELAAGIDRLLDTVEQSRAAALDAVTALGDAREAQRRADAAKVRRKATRYHSEQCWQTVQALEEVADEIEKGGA